MAVTTPSSGSYTCCLCSRVSTTMKRCGRCMGRTYCSQECQVRDWRSGHKERCVRVGVEPELYARETMAVLGSDTTLTQTLTMLLYAAISRKGAVERVGTTRVCRYMMLVAINKPWRPESRDNYHPLMFCVIGEVEEGRFLSMVEEDVRRTNHYDLLTDPQRIPLLMIRSIRADPLGEEGVADTRYVACSTDFMYPWTEERSRCEKGCCATTPIPVKTGRYVGKGTVSVEKGKEEVEERASAEDFRKGGEMILESIFEGHRGSFGADDFVSGRCVIGLNYEPGSLVANGSIMVLEHVPHIRLLTDLDLKTGKPFTITLH